MTPSPTLLSAVLAARNEYRLLGAMLAALHYALWWDFGGALSRSLMLAHLGLFLLWQPLWRRELRLEGRASVVFVSAALALVVAFNWLLMAFWLLLLTGLIGGRVTTEPRERNVYLVAMLVLISELLVGTVPHIFTAPQVTLAVRDLFQYGMLPAPLALLLVPARPEGARPEPGTDFFYGLTASLLTAILALGSLLLMYTTGAEYAVALFQTLLVIALFMIAISWLWMPVAGFSGLGQMWERYVQNVGTPFEHWLARLTAAARTRRNAEEFLETAIAHLDELPWVVGVSWAAGGAEGLVGERGPHACQHRGEEMVIEIFARRPLGTALFLHAMLLLRLIDHFYQAKVHERELAERAHLKAVYETGARVTHDIKNLLQSLHTLSRVVQGADGSRAAEAQTLLRRQLPDLSERLQLSLDKLSTPAAQPAAPIALAAWWDKLQARNAGREVGFTARLEDDPEVPRDLFDSVADNLLENARRKRLAEPGIEILVQLEAAGGRLALRVSDTGTPIAAEVRAKLFRAPVRSRSGLGIGLYQAERQARSLGYRMRLEQEAGRVSFVLERLPVTGGARPGPCAA